MGTYHIKDKHSYTQNYKTSIEDPETFWGTIAKDNFWLSLQFGNNLLDVWN